MPASVMRLLANGSEPASGATMEMLARGSRARLRPCSAMFDTLSTGAPASNP